MTILGLLPVSALLLLFLAWPGEAHNHGQRAVSAALAWGVLIVALTESLSLPGFLTQGTVAAAWLLINAALVAYILRAKVDLRARLTTCGQAIFEDSPALMAGLVILLFVLLLVSLAGAPNYFDALTYHMSRVMHWVQNRGVEHYIANDTRQLVMPPFSEFVILHFQLLTGNDRFASLVQWLSMAGSLVVVSLIAKQLGAGNIGRSLAIVAAATIPSGILEASSVQNNYVVSFWLACLAYLILAGMKGSNCQHWLKIGAALGLAILTKSTAYLFALPWVIGYAVYNLKCHPRDVLKVGSIVGAAVLALNLGHYTRNMLWFGSPLGSPQDFHKAVNARFGLDVTLSNLVRNATDHLGTNPELSDRLTAAVSDLHTAFHLDVNDPDTTMIGMQFAIYPLSTYENLAGNLVHFVAGLIGFTLAFVHPTLRGNKNLRLYIAMILVAFIIFSFYLRWTLVHQRLQLSLFILAAPVLGVAASQTLRPFSVQILASGLLLLSLPYLVFNNLRPLIGLEPYTWNESILTTDRTHQYFNEIRLPLEPAFEGAVESLDQSSCRRIGLVSKPESFEYLLWVLLQQTGAEYRIYPINENMIVPNTASARASRMAIDDVCLIVYLLEYTDAGPPHSLAGYRGTLIYESLYLMVSRLD